MIVNGEANKIFAALAKAQSQFEKAHKSTKGNRGKYADMASVWDAISGPLADNGIFISQYATDTVPGEVGIVTVIASAAGYIEYPPVILPVPKGHGTNEAQNVGMAITYARRYALEAIFCLSRVEDTDGIASAPPMSDGHKPQAAKEQPDSKRKPITDGQKKKLHAIGKKFYGDEWNAKRKELVEWVTTGNAESSDQLTTKEASTLIDGIQTKLDKQAELDKQKAEALLAEQA